MRGLIEDKILWNEWIETVRHEMYLQEGLHLSELPSHDWYKSYNFNLTPEQAIEVFYREYVYLF